MKACGELVSEAIQEATSKVIDPYDYSALYHTGIQLAEKGHLVGKAALCLLDTPPEQEDFTRSRQYNCNPSNLHRPHMFHGTPVPPDVMGKYIEARTCFSLQDGPGSAIPHGPTGASFSASGSFPRIRAIFHHDNPAFAGLNAPFILARRQSAIGLSLSITPRSVFEAAIEREAEGWVYTTAALYGPYFRPLPGYADQREYRTPSDTTYHYYTRVTARDLPRFLVVADGPPDALWDFINAIPFKDSFADAAQLLGVNAIYASVTYPVLQEQMCIHDLETPAVTHASIEGVRLEYAF